MLTINQIEYYNWRPFYGNQEIIFATDNQKNVTLIRGNNETGKTSIMQGIQWAFYGGSFFESKKLNPERMLNMQAKLDEKYEYSVTIHLTNNDKKFVIKRSSKVQSGKKPKSQNFLESVSVTGSGNVSQGDDAQKIINGFFESEISRFFLFDGEMLSNYERLIDGSDGEATKKIKKSIEDILRITQLRYAESALKEIQANALRDFTKDDTNSKADRERAAQILALKEKLKSIKDKSIAISTQVDDLKEKREVIEKFLLKNKNKSDLILKRAEIKEKIRDNNVKIAEHENDLGQLFENVHYDFLGSIKEKISINLRNKQEDLNKTIRQIAFQDAYRHLLENEEISEDSKLAISKKINNNLNDDQVKDEYDHIKRKLKSLEGKTFISSRSDIVAKSELLRELKTDNAFQQSALNILMSENDDGQDNTTNKDLQDALKQSQTLSETIGKKEEQLDDSKEGTLAWDIAQTESSLKLLNSQNPDTSALNFSTIYKSISDDLQEIFSETIEVAIRDARNSIEQEANTIHTKLRSNRGDSDRTLKINKNYGLETVLGDNYDESLDRSAGGTQIVALSLIISLRNNAGVQAPLIIDTPMGRLDNDYRKTTLELLPKIGTQFVLLVQPGELEEHTELDTLIRKNVGKIYEIKPQDDRRGEIINTL